MNKHMPQEPKISIISYHFSTDSEISNTRPLLLYKAIKEWKPDSEVKIYCSAFDHIKKKVVDYKEEDFVPLKVPAYSRNISIQRLYSYNVFAIKLLNHFLLKQSDLIIICVPTNAPIFSALLYKILWKIPFVIDVVDLWPEAFPLSPKLKNMINPLIQRFIKPLRANLYKQADFLTTQSYYFSQKLNLPDPKDHVISMSSSASQSSYKEFPKESSINEEIRLVYLGSINHIIDLESLIKIVTTLSKSRLIHLSVIGGGDKLEYLKKALPPTNITTTFYGICFDLSIRSKELSLAHFGYNGYLDNTEVALSYKSLDYFAHSLPVLNSAKGDSYELIVKYRCGFNFTEQTLDSVINSILDLDDNSYQQMRTRTGQMFDQTLSWPVFVQRVQETIKPLI